MARRHIGVEELFEIINLGAWNIKILPVVEGIYNDLFVYAKEKGPVDVLSDYVITVRSLTTIDPPLSFEGELIYYSKESELEVYDEPQDRMIIEQLREGAHLSPKTARFFFLPSVHRLCVEVKSKRTSIPERAIQNYLTKILKEYMEYRGIAHDHTSQVCTVTKRDAIAQILSRNDITYIRASISYTNDDQTEDYAHLLENQGRESAASSLQIIANSESDAHLQPRGTILEGAVRLAEQNGEAIVKCKSPMGEIKVFNTKKYPLQREFKDSSEVNRRDIFEWIRSKFQ